MSAFTYTPDDDTKVHEEGAIRLICSAFRSHESGLPEWLKNAADAYSRNDVGPEERVVIVILADGKGQDPASISCLDFCGMTSKVIEEDFRYWADPNAAARTSSGGPIQGGHGNGGKCYMTQMFDDYALLTTIKDGKGNRYGVQAGSVKFGYIPNKKSGRDFRVVDHRKQLDDDLRSIRCAIDTFPAAIQKAIKMSSGYTLVTGVGPKTFGRRLPVQKIIEELEDHTQMIQTLESCSVYVISNGKVHEQDRPIRLPEIPPIPGSEVPRVIAIPELLGERGSSKKISTTEGGKLVPGSLTLRTSDKSMRWGRKGRHNISYRTSSGYIGFVPVLELDVQSPYRDRIYGECDLESLTAYKQNDRSRLASSPLTRAIEQFISSQVEIFAKEFEARDRRQYSQDEKSILSRMNEALDRWKNRFLDDYMRGQWGQGGPNPPPPPPLPSGKPSRIEISLSHHMAGVGVSFRPTARFFSSDGKHIRPVPFRWISDDPNTALIDEDLQVVNTFKPGRTILYAETLDGRLVSNKEPMDVVLLRSIEIVPKEISLSIGGRQRLIANCVLDDGRIASDVYLIWTESNPTIASVSSAGLVYGHALGHMEVTVGDDRCTAIESASVTVGEATGKEHSKNRGKGFPRVLVSGEIDKDPDSAEFVHFSVEDPPVWQRPQDVDRSIWWINSAAPLAKLYLSRERGYGYESREWRMYHIERLIDVIVQIALTNGPKEVTQLSVNEWIMQWGSKVSEIQTAISSELADFIDAGALPQV